jgi:hypothetical protein
MVHVSRRSFVQGTAGLFVVFSLPRASAASTTTVLVTIGRLFIHSHRAREATWQLNKAAPRLAFVSLLRGSVRRVRIAETRRQSRAAAKHGHECRSGVGPAAPWP